MASLSTQRLKYLTVLCQYKPNNELVIYNWTTVHKIVLDYQSIVIKVEM